MLDVEVEIIELVDLRAELEGERSRFARGGYVVSIFLRESCAVGRVSQVGESRKVGNRIIVAGSSGLSLAMQRWRSGVLVLLDSLFCT